MVYLFAAIYGIAYGTFEVLESPIIADLFGLGSLGVIMAVAFAVSTIGFALGPVVAGHIFDVTGSYQLAFIICATMVIIGAVLNMLLPLTRGER